MLTFIINCEKAIERRNYITKHFRQFGINDFTLINAIDGSQLSDAEIADVYDIENHRHCAQRSLSRAEIGCALSHLMCYQQLIDSDKQGAFIFEDDCKLNSQTVNVMHAITKTPLATNAVVLLSFVIRYKRKIIAALTENYSLHKIMTRRTGANFLTHGYYISRQAASNLLSTLKNIDGPIDQWDRFTREKHITTYMVFPYCVSLHQQHSENSSIEQHRHRPKLKNQFIPNSLKKLFWQCLFFASYQKKEELNFDNPKTKR